MHGHRGHEARNHDLRDVVAILGSGLESRTPSYACWVLFVIKVTKDVEARGYRWHGRVIPFDAQPLEANSPALRVLDGAAADNHLLFDFITIPSLA